MTALSEFKDQSLNWASTMRGIGYKQDFVLAHGDEPDFYFPFDVNTSNLRENRENIEKLVLSPRATFSEGAGNRSQPEVPDKFRTCFQKDKDRILHSTVFRRLAGKTQVFIFPSDHQRTRLTHALEVNQVATSISRALNLNVDLTEAIALGHDCGHGPGGHASEAALSIFLPDGFDHASFGADIALKSLNLCSETLDGIRNHTWSKPSPSTQEGQVVSWADRIAYVCHDFEDAKIAGIVKENDLPEAVTETVGLERSRQLNLFISAVISSSIKSGIISMDTKTATALGEFRKFNYENIYMRDDSVEQTEKIVKLLRKVVEFLVLDKIELKNLILSTTDLDENETNRKIQESPTITAVEYVAKMTDKFVIDLAVNKLGYLHSNLPKPMRI